MHQLKSECVPPLRAPMQADALLQQLRSCVVLDTTTGPRRLPRTTSQPASGGATPQPAASSMQKAAALDAGAQPAATDAVALAAAGDAPPPPPPSTSILLPPALGGWVDWSTLAPAYPLCMVSAAYAHLQPQLLPSWRWLMGALGCVPAPPLATSTLLLRVSNADAAAAVAVPVAAQAGSNDHPVASCSGSSGGSSTAGLSWRVTDLGPAGPSGCWLLQDCSCPELTALLAVLQEQVCSAAPSSGSGGEMAASLTRWGQTPKAFLPSLCTSACGAGLNSY